MFQRFEPGVLRLFVTTSLTMLFLPILVYYFALCICYLDLSSSLSPSYKVFISGISAVVTVNVVIGVFMFIVYKNDIKQKSN
jgi:VMA21-like domain.